MFRLNFNASISSHFACPQTRPPKLGFKAVAEVVKTFVTRRKPKLLTSSATNVAEGKEKWAEVHYGLSSAILFGRRRAKKRCPVPFPLLGLLFSLKLGLTTLSSALFPTTARHPFHTM